MAVERVRVGRRASRRVRHRAALPPSEHSALPAACTPGEYAELLTLRTRLRQFLRWSEHQARSVGMTPAVHQLLLVVAGHPDPAGATISDAADYLLLRHHSVVELVNRAEASGWLRRAPDATDGRVVRLQLTPLAERRLAELTARHRAELNHLSTMFTALTVDHPEPAASEPSTTHEQG